MTRALLLVLLTLPQDGLEPGLVAEYFDLEGGASDFPKIPADRKPAYARVEPQVDRHDVSGDFYGTRMSVNFYARWSGLLRIERPGNHTFFTESDDGSRLSIDGKVVVANGGVHAMAEKSGAVALDAGDHPILVELFQAGGEAGIIVSWQPPGEAKRAISPRHFFHRKGSAEVAWDRAAWEKRPQGKTQSAREKRGEGKYALMDHGPFASGTIDALWGGKGNFAHKGFALTLDREKQAHVCFDSELLKIVSGWTGGAVAWPSGRDGLEGQPFAGGAVRFGTKKGSLGWKGKDWADPRPKPFGPLPREHGRYGGLYVHGDKLVLSYAVSGTEVLEMPGFEAKEGLEVFTRAFQVARPAAPLLHLVCDGGPATLADGVALLESAGEVTAVGLAGAPAGVRLAASGTRVELEIGAAGRFLLALWTGSKADLGRFQAWLGVASVPDLAPLLKGGPGRNAPVTTAGKIGNDPGAYQVDTLTVPYDNPSKSYMRLTGVDFFSDGKRAAACTMDGDVWIVSGIDEKLEKLTWKRFASGLFQSLGLRIVDDVVYTLGRDQITRFHDFNGDGEADFYENFNNDCGVTVAYHEFTHDLQTDAQGNFYYAKGSDLGNAKVPYHGCVVRVSKDGKSSEVFSRGFRAPNGMSVGPDGTVTTSDNQGNWVPTTPINYFTRPGEFGGFVPCSFRSPAPRERPNPLCWIPYAADNSGGGQEWCTSDRWGPFKGQLFHFSYGKCALFYILREKAGDEWQGGAIRFPFKFLSGVMRGRFNAADGQLYLVGMRGWQTDANRDGCFQRVRYTGKPANLPLSARVRKDGIEVTFTDPLDRETASDAERWSASWCDLRYTGNYGSDEYWVSDPNRKGREPLPIQGAKLSPDGKTVSLAIEGLKPCAYLVLKYRLKAADGTPISQEFSYTINRLP